MSFEQLLELIGRVGILDAVLIAGIIYLWRRLNQKDDRIIEILQSIAEERGHEARRYHEAIQVLQGIKEALMTKDR